MLNENQLKEKLQLLEKNEFQPAKMEDLSELLQSMLVHIGSTDSELRDDLIYTCFAQWILRLNLLEEEQLHSLLAAVLDEDHMLYKIGEQNSDSVFRRSFSVLLLPLLLIKHRSQAYLTHDEIYSIKAKLIFFLQNEKDHRGFVSGKGWAHAIAHSADALDDLARCSEMTREDLADLLEVVYNIICIENDTYTCLEEERVATAVIAVLKTQKLPDAEVNRWILGFADRVLPVTTMPNKLILRGNVKDFLQSLYFRVKWQPALAHFADPIDQVLHDLNQFCKYDAE